MDEAGHLEYSLDFMRAGALLLYLILPRGREVMLLPKAFYFCYYAAIVSLLPFLLLHYEQLGFSEARIGILAAIPPFVTVWGAPLWGGLADSLQRHKALLLLTIGGAMLAAWLLSMAKAYLTLILLASTFALCMAPIMPLIDSSVLALLGERKGEYGKQRLWGAVGWGMFAPITGFVTERGGLIWAFYGFLFFMACGLLVAIALPVKGTAARGRYSDALRVLATNRQWGLFLMTALVGGMGLAVVSNFLFLFLEDLDASRVLMGLSLTAATVSEIPIMFYSDRLLERWSPRGLMIAALLSYVVRAWAYSLMGPPWLALPIQLLHGPSFAALWVAGVSYTDAVAPPTLRATAQGLFSGVTFGLSAASGAFFGGLLYEGVGAHTMFRVVGMGVLVGALLFAFFSHERPRTRAIPLGTESEK